MNVLVTGGAGFIGSHVVDALLDRGDTVFVIDDLSTGNRANLDGRVSEGRLYVESARVEDSSQLGAWIDESDMVLHFAASVGVRRVMENRVRTLRTNVQSTEEVLEHASRSGTPVFIASTSEVYGSSTAVPFSEDLPIQLSSPDAGRWGYAASKAMSEFMALAYANEKSLPVVIGRLFNTAGPRQVGAYGMVLPRFVEQALSGEPITVFGDGTQTRSFVHVADVARAVLGLMDTPAAIGGIFNIGNDAEISIGALARRVVELTNSSSVITLVPYEKVYRDFLDMQRRVPDLSRITRTIGYRPTKDIDDIILSAVRYARDGSPLSE